ncbi:MAG TPA: hypothetical protein VGI10_25750 [Polyangiaceae bacterium]
MKRRCLGALVASALSLACHGGDAPTVYVIVGASPDDHLEFKPQASYAQYVDLPNLHRELRITLSSFDASCEDFSALGANGSSTTVSVLAPSGTPIEPGEYPWAGHAAHGGTEAQPEHPYALPSARVGPRSVFFEPGGEIELDNVPSELGGKVRGQLSFEFPGDADHPATSLKGQFSASLCRVRL